MYIRRRQEWSRATETEAREKEFPWDYAAVFCVPLKDRSCPGIGLPPSDGDESNPATFFRDVSLSAYRDENASDTDLSFFFRQSVRGRYEERILISIHYQFTRTALNFILFRFRINNARECTVGALRGIDFNNQNTFCIYSVHRLYKVVVQRSISIA